MTFKTEGILRNVQPSMRKNHFTVHLLC